MCRLSVNCVAVVTAVLLLIICATISISVTLTFAIDAADDSARRFTSAIAHAGRTKVEDYVATPVEKAVGLRTTFMMPGVAPDFFNHSTPAAERRAALDRFLFQRAPIFLEANFSCLYVGFGLEDGTWCSCFISDAATRSYACDVQDPTISFGGGYTEWRQYKFTGEQNTGYSQSPDNYDPRNRAWYQVVKADGGADANWRFSDTLVDFAFNIPIVDLNVPMVLPNGSFAGVTSVTLALRDLSEFLRQIPGTANSVSVLIDNKGLLLGTSDLTDLYRVLLNTSAALAMYRAPGACEDVNTTHMLCRFGLKDTQSRPLFEAASALPGLFRPGDRPPESSYAQTNNRAYYVVSNPVNHAMITKGLEWRLVTVVPAADLMGGIVRGRDIAIGLVAAVVVLSSVMCATVLYILLRPLQLVAQRMYEVATLRGKATQAPVGSRLHEVASIETAFDNLNDQLQRALVFLPPSLRAALEGDTDPSEGALHATESTSLHPESVHSDQEGSLSATSQRSARSHTRGGGHNRKRSATSESAMERMRATDGISTALSIKSSEAHSSDSDSRVHVALAAAVATQRTITVVQLNLRGFHKQLTEGSGGAAVALGLPYGSLVSMVNAAANTYRGVIDVFCGDHFMLTFNAVRSCASHVTSATAAAMHMGERLTVPWTCGIACGAALVGNMGSADTRRFTTVGNVVRQAATLERLCKVIPPLSSSTAATLASRQVATEVMHVADVLFVDVVPLPGTNGATPIAAVSALGKCGAEGATEDNEWMYELIARVSPHKRKAVFLNDAFAALSRGDATGATQHADAFRKAVVEERACSSPVRPSTAELLDVDPITPHSSLGEPISGLKITNVSPTTANNANDTTGPARTKSIGASTVTAEICPLSALAFNTLQTILASFGDAKKIEQRPPVAIPPHQLSQVCLSHAPPCVTATIDHVLQVVAQYRSPMVFTADFFSTVFLEPSPTSTTAESNNHASSKQHKHTLASFVDAKNETTTSATTIPPRKGPHTTIMMKRRSSKRK